MSTPVYQLGTESTLSTGATTPSSVPGSPVDLAAYDAFVAAKRVQTVETGFAPPLPLSPGCTRTRAAGTWTPWEAVDERDP